MEASHIVSNEIDVREIVEDSHKTLFYNMEKNIEEFSNKLLINFAKSISHRPSQFFKLVFNTAALKIELK